MDLKALATEHDDLKTLVEDGDLTLDDEDRERLGALDKLAKDLRDDLIDAAREGYHFIEKRCFDDYARELVEERHPNTDFKSWPFDCIDWCRVADFLSLDYSEVEWEGVTYLYLDP